MEKGKISESIPIMKPNNNSSSPTTKPLDFAIILKYLVIFFTLGVAFLILSYASYNTFEPFRSSVSNQNNLSINTEMVKNEYNELKNVLKAASTKEKTVILTTLNEAWAAPNSIFDLFLESFRNGNDTIWLLNHLLVIAVDDKAYIQCKKLVSHCYFLKTKQSSMMAHEARFMTPIYIELMWERLGLLQTILSLGYNFVFTVKTLTLCGSETRSHILLQTQTSKPPAIITMATNST
ncbi:hypothetical protein RDABS01_028612 [Bienertia sinuspersici]